MLQEPAKIRDIEGGENSSPRPKTPAGCLDFRVAVEDVTNRGVRDAAGLEA
jgi:hypothetical protein